MSDLTAIQGSTGFSIPLRTPEVRPAESDIESFANALRAAAAPVTEAHATVEHELGRLVRGEAEDLHSVQIAMQKADLRLQLLLQVRNKVMQAYQEIMQMAV